MDLASPRRRPGRSSLLPGSSVFLPASVTEASRNSPSACSAQRSRFGQPLRHASCGSSPERPTWSASAPTLASPELSPASRPRSSVSLWFVLHALFGTASATRHGPLRLWTPDPASLNVEVLMLAILAALLLFGLRFGIVSTLPLTTAASLAWWFLQGAI